MSKAAVWTDDILRWKHTKSLSLNQEEWKKTIVEKKRGKKPRQQPLIFNSLKVLWKERGVRKSLIVDYEANSR